MKNVVRRAHARSAVICLPVEMAQDQREEKYPGYVGVLIAVGASALLWTLIASIASAIV